MRQLFTLGIQSIGASASASVSPVNIQGWFPSTVLLIWDSYSKSQYRVTIRSNSPAPCYIPKRIKNMYSHKNLDMNVHGLLFIIAQSGNSPSKKVNSSKVEVSITLWIDEQNTQNIVVVVQPLNHVRLCNPMGCGMPGSSVFHYLLEFAQIYLPWVSDAT